MPYVVLTYCRITFRNLKKESIPIEDGFLTISAHQLEKIHSFYSKRRELNGYLKCRRRHREFHHENQLQQHISDGIQRQYYLQNLQMEKVNEQ